MQFTKVTDEERALVGNVGQPDTPNLSTSEMQEVMDSLPNLGIDKFNNHIDELLAATKESITGDGSNDEYPTTKAVYDYVKAVSTDEIVDARKDVHNVVQETLGVAIRSQITEVANAVQSEENRAVLVEGAKINKPFQEGTAGQVLKTNGDGTTEWDNAPTAEEIDSALVTYFEEHPDEIPESINGLTSRVVALETQNGTVALETTAQTLSGAVNELRNDIRTGYVTPEMYGAVGNGINDDTNAINNAIVSGYNVVFGNNKTYRVTGHTVGDYICAICIDNPVVVDFNNSCIILDKEENAYVFECYISSDNVTLLNPQIIGSVEDSDETITYSDSHGLAIKGCKDVTIINAIIKNCEGDGIYMSNVENINILGKTSLKKIGRNGVSIINADTVCIDNLYGKDIKYNAPKVVLDIEPNRYTQNCKNIIVSKIFADECGGGANAISVGGQLSGNIAQIICNNCGGNCFSASYLAGNDTGTQVHVNDNNKFIVNSIIGINHKNVAIFMKNTNSSKMPYVSVKNVHMYNYSQDAVNNAIPYDHALIYYQQASNVTGFDNHGNFEVLNVHFDNSNILPISFRDNNTSHNDPVKNTIVEIKSPVLKDRYINVTLQAKVIIAPPPFRFGSISAGSDDRATYSSFVNKLFDYSVGDYEISGYISGKGGIGCGIASLREEGAGNVHLISDQYTCSIKAYYNRTFRAYETVGSMVVS